MSGLRSGGVVLAVACVLFTYSAASNTWWTTKHNGPGFGLVGVSYRHGESAAYSDLLDQTDDASSDRSREEHGEHEALSGLLWRGRIALIGCLLAIVATGIRSVRAFMGRSPNVAWVAGIMIPAAITGYFFAGNLDDDLFFRDLDRGAAVYTLVAGIILGLIGDSIVMRAQPAAPPPSPFAQAPPFQAPPFMPPPPQAPLAPVPVPQASQAFPPAVAAASTQPCPACPNCRAPTTYVAEFSRYLCERCNLYV